MPPDQKLFSDSQKIPSRTKDNAEPAREGHARLNGSDGSASGWALPEITAGWGLDLTGGSANLPPPGQYDASIEEVRLSDQPTVLWLIVRYRLDGVEAEPAADIAAICALPGSEHAHRLPDGMRLLNRLAAAAHIDLNAVRDPFDLPELFERKRVTLKLAHRERDGVCELVVRAIMPVSP